MIQKIKLFQDFHWTHFFHSLALKKKKKKYKIKIAEQLNEGSYIVQTKAQPPEKFYCR